MQRLRPAFSLAGLIVVIAIIALLVGLMLPAIQKVREAAARAQSQNNLKQIALSFHNYESANGTTVPGVDKDNASALVHLLPYIEQDAVYKQYTEKGRKAIEGVQIKTYLSPRDPAPADASKDLAPTNYQFNAGTEYSLKNNNGTAYRDSKLNFPAFTDGTSNTVMAGETLRGVADGPSTVQRQHVRLKPAELKKLDDESGIADFKAGKNIAADRGASWADGRFLQATYTGTRKINATEPDVDCGGTGGLSALRMFGGGANVAMVDGSVRFVSESISLKTWKDIHTRNGGEVVGPDF
jgi:prepilin-type processing-associated H-X9-DG protein